MGAGDAGDTDAAIAAAQLTLIATAFTERPHRPRPAGDTRRSPSGPAHAPIPVDLDVVDHMTRAVHEVIAQTRTLAGPEAGPAPSDAAAVYGWMRDNTRTLDDQRRQAAEATVYRQTLEHALAMGDESVVRRHPCPACGCYGLFWRAATRRAVCVNRRCAEEETLGQSRTWPLNHLAYLHIQARKESSLRSAT